MNSEESNDILIRIEEMDNDTGAFNDLNGNGQTRDIRSCLTSPLWEETSDNSWNMVNLSRWEGQYNNDDRIVRNSLPGFMSIPMFARFIVDDIKIKFWPSEYHNITEEFESAGQETGVDIGFTTPTDFSTAGNNDLT